MNAVKNLQVIKAAVLGHAVGDALGLPFQFNSKLYFDLNPVTDMEGYGVFDKPKGSWSDDTSMTLCALDALSEENFSWEKVMDNFCSWYFDSNYTPYCESYDKGNTCSISIREYRKYRDVNLCGQSGERDNGNGSLMRIIPFILYDGENIPFIEKAGSLTHAHEISKVACGIYSFVMRELIENPVKNSVKAGLEKAKEYYRENIEWNRFDSLMEIERKNEFDISGRAYVVSTLEAALWCLMNTCTYKECVLKAVNLGDDTDTVAAVAGGLAGILYGIDSIPQEWLDSLIRKDYIENMCERAWRRWQLK